MPAAVLIPLLISGASMGAQMGLSFLMRPKQKPTDVGKFDDPRILGSDYGGRIFRGWGTYRCSGQIVFATGVTDYVVTTGGTTGGKGGGGGPVTNTHIYKTSIGVLVSRGPMSVMEKIWDDADVVLSSPGYIYTDLFEAEDAVLDGGAYIVSPSPGASNDASVSGLGAKGSATFDMTTVPDPEAPFRDPTQIATAYTRTAFWYKCTGDQLVDITTDDGSGPVTNTYTLPSSDDVWTSFTRLIPGFIHTLMFAYNPAPTADLDLIAIEKYWHITGHGTGDISFNVTGAVNTGLAYPPDIDDPSEYYNRALSLTKDGTTGIYSVTTPIPGQAIRIYSGTETQTADSAIIAWLDTLYGTGQGVLRASAMRGLVWVMFENYTLKAPRAPNYTFQINTGDDTVNGVLEDLFADVGLESGDYDISATASDYTQIGVVENSGGSRKALIESLGKYHQFRIAEIDGKIVTIPDAVNALATIDANLLRAHAFGETMPLMDAEVTIREETLMPREIRVSGMNPDLEFHNDTATAQMFTVAGTESRDETFPIVDTLDKFRLTGERLLLKEYSEDRDVNAFGMPALAQYAVGDCFNLPINGLNVKVRVEKKRMPLPMGVVTLECVATGYNYNGVTFQSGTTTAASKGILQFTGPKFPRNSIVVAIQSLPIFQRDKGRLGIYLATCGRGLGNGDPVAIYREFAADNFLLQMRIEAASPVGLAQSALPDFSPISTVDTTNSLTIYFFDDIQLESVMASDIIAYPTLNLARVGDEWLQFRTAVSAVLPVDSPYRSAWTISNLTRGRFGTSAAVPSHGADEYVSIVTPALKFYPLEESDIGNDITLKAITNGQDIEVAPTTLFNFNPISSYTITNDTANRTLDANNVTINDLSDVVATIIRDEHL